MTSERYWNWRDEQEAEDDPNVVVDPSTVECPYCHAKPAEACTRARSRTREGDEGHPDVPFFHQERVRLAKKQARPSSEP